MDMKALARSFHLKGDKIAWLLGAGVSAAAGVPTAWQLTWEFKRLIFCTEQDVSPKLCSDLGDQSTRDRIQAYFNAKGGHPPQDSQEEYGHYFELAYPRAKDRQAFVEREFSEKQPTYGHQALAALMHIRRVRLLFTTNFDSLLERAFEGTPSVSLTLKQVTLDSAQLAVRHLQNDQFPLLVKLHGDFRSDRLKNIAEELKSQDTKLRQSLTEAARRFGLIVVGYSGRDESIMAAIHDALTSGVAFPHGLFWLHKTGRAVLPSVTGLIAKAKAANVDAHLLQVGTFDEVMRDFVVLETSIPEATRQQFRKVRPILGTGAIPSGDGRWPVTRLNALKVLDLPTTCRLLTGARAQAREVAAKVLSASNKVAAVRHKGDILAFGNDQDLSSVFRDLHAGPMDIAPIARERFFAESGAQSLLYQIIVSAICRRHACFEGRTGRRAKIIVKRALANDATLKPLSTAVGGALVGALPSGSGHWAESVRFGIDTVGNELAILVTPWVEMVLPANAEVGTPDKEFLRERMAKRYNKVSNALLSAWIQVLSGDGKTIDFSMEDGRGAVRLLAASGYSWSLR